MFNITSKYFSFFNSKPSASWVAHVARDFLTYYSCSCYSSMYFLNILRILQNIFKKYLNLHCFQKIEHVPNFCQVFRIKYEVRCTIWYRLYKLPNLLKVKLLHGRFSLFLDCTNGTKSRNASLIRKIIWTLTCT